MESFCLTECNVVYFLSFLFLVPFFLYLFGFQPGYLRELRTIRGSRNQNFSLICCKIRSWADNNGEREREKITVVIKPDQIFCRGFYNSRQVSGGTKSDVGSGN